MLSYGPEMRGDTANCITIVSNEPISFPIVSLLDTTIVLNHPSTDKFVHLVKPIGLLLYDNATLLKRFESDQIEIFRLAATTVGVALAKYSFHEYDFLGAYLTLKPVLPMHAIIHVLRHVQPKKYHQPLPANQLVLEKGSAWVVQFLPAAIA